MRSPRRFWPPVQLNGEEKVKVLSAMALGPLMVLSTFSPHQRMNASELDKILVVAVTSDKDAASPVRGQLIELQLTNKSAQDIVAYQLDITAASPDGSAPRTTNLGEDGVVLYAGVGRIPPQSDKYVQVEVLHPNETIYKRVGSPFDVPVSLHSFSITSIVFGDNTALGNQDFIDNIFYEHSIMADELQHWRDTLRGVSDEADRHRWAIEIGKLRSLAIPGREESARNQMRYIAEQEFGRPEMTPSKRDWVIAYWSDLVRAYRDHSERQQRE